MAKVSYGAMVTAITGSIGGTTFQNTISGAIIRNKPNGRKSSTMKQSTQRQNPSFYINKWQALTLAQQGLWNVFAGLHPHVNSYGQSRNLTGFDWHWSVNYNLLSAGLPYIPAPPIYIAPGAVSPYTLTLSSVKIEFTFAGIVVQPNTAYIVNLTFRRTSGALQNRSLYRRMEVIVVGGFAALNETVKWNSYFGASWATTPSGSKVILSGMIQPFDTRSGVSGAGLFASAEIIFP